MTTASKSDAPKVHFYARWVEMEEFMTSPAYAALSKEEQRKLDRQHSRLNGNVIRDDFNKLAAALLLYVRRNGLITEEEWEYVRGVKEIRSMHWYRFIEDVYRRVFDHDYPRSENKEPAIKWLSYQNRPHMWTYKKCPLKPTTAATSAPQPEHRQPEEQRTASPEPQRTTAEEDRVMLAALLAIAATILCKPAPAPEPEPEEIEPEDPEQAYYDQVAGELLAGLDI